MEEQVAIIYASTKGLMDKVPVDKVKEFENEFLTLLRTQHGDVLKTFKAGKLEESATNVLVSVAKDLTSRY